MANRGGDVVLFEEAPIHPLELVTDRDELWVVNIPNASVSVFDLADPLRPRLAAEIPVGLGPVTLRRRPGAGERREMWVVCQSSNAVFVVDLDARRVVDTVRVAFEPSGLVFDDAGATAYVALSASDRIARIDATARRELAPIAAASALGAPYHAVAHVQEPRALLLEGDALYALSYRSGNGTAVDKLDRDGDRQKFEVVDLWSAPELAPPPDRDVLRFDTARPGDPGTAALWRMGTLNLDLARGPPGGLWVSNVDLLNAERAGRYDLRRRGFARHRVSFARESADGQPQTGTRHVDLNADRHPELPADVRCALPNAMALAADGRRLFVACYETRNAMVVDTQEARVTAVLTADADPAVGVGPRGLALHEAAGVVYVYYRGDNTLRVYRLPAADDRVVAPAGPAVPVGFDPTPAAVKAGRRHFIDAANSATGTHSCNTCHSDGQPDGLAWDLSAHTGDLDRAPQLRDDARDVKLTQDLRGIEATPPYHWQGNRADLGDFNPAFAALLGGRQLAPQAFRELAAYVFALALPPNPGQPADRTYSARALAGYGCFEKGSKLPFSTHVSGIPAFGGAPAGRVTLACQDCHAAAGALFTNNQLVNDARFPVPRVTAGLRGLFDRGGDAVRAADEIWPAPGWGFGNTGVFASLEEFITVTFAEVTAAENELLRAFLGELDSGMAPATAFAWTLTPRSAAAPAAGHPVTTYLMPQARLGHADVAVRGWLDLDGEPRPVGLLYEPHRGRFVADRAGAGPFVYEELVERVRDGRGTLTFLGAPVGSGYRLGLDRDLDFLLDGDEAARGTSTAAADSDGDGFADGYEARLGSDPADAASRPADRTAPAISEAQVAWTAATVAEIRWATDEETIGRVRVLAGDDLVWEGEEPWWRREHRVVVRGLAAGRAYDVVIASRDPARPPNVASATLELRTPAPLFPHVHVARTELRIAGRADDGTLTLEAGFEVRDERGRAVTGAEVHARLLEWVPGTDRSTLRELLSAPSDARGRAVLRVPSTLTADAGGRAEVIVDRRWDRGVRDVADERLYFFPADRENQFWAQVELR